MFIVIVVIREKNVFMLSFIHGATIFKHSLLVQKNMTESPPEEC